MRARVAISLLFLCLCAPFVLGVRSAAADPPPVFEGPPALTTFTKEVSVEGSVIRLGDGTPATGFGLSMGFSLTPWLGLVGGIEGGYALTDPRQFLDARGALRFIWPEPAGPLFLYASLGVDVFMIEVTTSSHLMSETFGLAGGVGAFANLGSRLRLYLEGRDAWLVANADGFDHNLFVTLGLSVLFR